MCLLAGLDHYGRLTDPMGVRMAEFPLSPMFAKMLLESGNFGCSKEIVTIAAMMQIQNLFVVPPNQKKAAVSKNFQKEHVAYSAEMLCRHNNWPRFVISPCRPESTGNLQWLRETTSPC